MSSQKNKKSQNGSENLKSRPPVVVVLGHVDHGKSSLLEAIKEDFRITSRESGGITQHVGAYEVEYQNKKITFIDTPGHEAFSAMRSRGANIADIAILVVAADEGVKEQTKEAILHAKKSGALIIVAINKMDKPGADPEKVKRELAKEDILAESMGGKVPMVNVSAKEKKGINDLLELILLVAEMEDLKNDMAAPAEGVVIEAYLDAKRGLTTTLLVRSGILREHNIIGTPSTTGKVRIMENFMGELIKEALPSQPAIVTGWQGMVKVGENFKIFSDAETATKYAEKKERKRKVVEVIEPDKKIVNIILKADVQGSLEAIEAMLKEFSKEEIDLRILEKEVGDINENDVQLAKSAKAFIVGFRVKAGMHVAQLAEQNGVSIKTFEIIYELAQGVRHLMERQLGSTTARRDLGRLKVLLVFMTEKNRQIVGGRIIEGEIKKSGLIEIWRDQELIGRGRMINLQKNKKDIDLAKRGEEVGILYEGDGPIIEGDILQIYVEERQRLTL